jgi:hypothetical protein
MLLYELDSRAMALADPTGKMQVDTTHGEAREEGGYDKVGTQTTYRCKITRSIVHV